MTALQIPVVIVGAGPTGLNLALWLTKAQIPVRIIDKHTKAGEASRAMVVHARTLEFYEQLGIADQVVAQGTQVDQIQIRREGKTLPTIRLGDVGADLSPYPFLLGYPQDAHEHLLTQVLAELGVTIEWNTELVSFTQDGQQVVAILKQGEQEQTITCQYLCGCDGASSTVRHQLGLGFGGDTYEQLFYVADIEANNAQDYSALSPCLNDNIFTLVFPLPQPNAMRLVGIVPADLVQQEHLSFDTLQPYVEQLTGVQVVKCHWFSTYHVHHRVAESFQKGRVFIAGDAGHIHSPAGGQGMNTGIGDAINLAWKLQEVLKHQANPKLLDTYNAERLSFAKVLVESADTAFTWLVGSDWHSWLVQKVLAPFVLPIALEFESLRRLMFKTVSQIRIQYHESELSQGKVGELQAGDRLPWVKALNNFKPLASRTWQIHIYGTASNKLKFVAQALSLPIIEFNWVNEAGDKVLQQDALYLIRPDGYIALMEAHQDVAVLKDYWAQWYHVL